MTISGVIPVYNRASVVSKAIDSALSQEYRGPYEVIVVDDGSTDSTPDVLAKYGNRIRVIRQENKGRSSARNVGVHHSRADIIAFLDSDDLWLPGKIGAVAGAFADADSDIGLIYSDHYEDSSGEDLAIRTFSDDPRLDLMFKQLEVIGPPSNVAVRRSLFEQIGGYDERLNWGEDIELLLRLRAVCRFKRIPAPLMVYSKRTEPLASVRAYAQKDRIAFERVMR